MSLYGRQVDRARTLAKVAGRRLELWTGDGRTPQRFTCPEHPGVALTIGEIRALDPDPTAYRYLCGPPPSTPCSEGGGGVDP